MSKNRNTKASRKKLKSKFRNKLNNGLLRKPVVQVEMGKPMKRYILHRHDSDNGFSIQLVKYRNADEVILIPTESLISGKGELKKNQTILGAIEMILPPSYNNQEVVNILHSQIGDLFVNMEDFRWFKAHKDGDFEKKGDNVIEAYGYMTYTAAESYIKVVDEELKKAV